MYWEILLLGQICIFISSSTLLTKAFLVIDILNHISPLPQQDFSITFNYVRGSVRLKLTSIYLMHCCHFKGQMFLHPMLQQAQLFSIVLQRPGSNTRHHLRVTHQLDLYSTSPRTQMLPLNDCSLSPFCSNTSTVHWFYGSTWDCYYNILEYFSGFLSGKCSSCTAIWRPAIPAHKLSNLFSLCKGVRSPSFERPHSSSVTKFITFRIKKSPDLGFQHWRFLYPEEAKSWSSTLLLFTPFFKWATLSEHLWEKLKAHLMKIQGRPSQLSSQFLYWISRPGPFMVPFKICLLHIIICMCFGLTGPVDKSRRHRSTTIL